MARVRNKTAEALDLRLNELVRHVEPDEAVEIPDEIFARYEWPETTWDVTEHARKASSHPHKAANGEEK